MLLLVVHMFKTDYFIAGIAPASKGNIVLLTYSEAEVRVRVSLLHAKSLVTSLKSPLFTQITCLLSIRDTMTDLVEITCTRYGQ